MTAMLTAVIHICDIRFTHDPDTDGSYIENEERLEIGEEVFIVSRIFAPSHRLITLDVCNWRERLHFWSWALCLKRVLCIFLLVSLLLGTDVDRLSAALTTNETTVSGCSSGEAHFAVSCDFMTGWYSCKLPCCTNGRNTFFSGLSILIMCGSFLSSMQTLFILEHKLKVQDNLR